MIAVVVGTLGLFVGFVLGVRVGYPAGMGRGNAKGVGGFIALNSREAVARKYRRGRS